MSRSARIRFLVVCWIIWLALLIAQMVSVVRAEERFGSDTKWRLVEEGDDGGVSKFFDENSCWHAYYSMPAERRRDAYCEPDKKWVMIEQSDLGVNTTGFKSEFGCFMSGVIASHQQGVGAQCMYLGDHADGE